MENDIVCYGMPPVCKVQ